MIGRVSEGMGITARKLNEVIDHLNRVLGLKVAAPLQLSQYNGSFQLSVGGIAGDNGLVVVRPTAAGAGDGSYAAATVQVRDSSGAWVDGTEAVLFRPYWAGMKQKINLLWRCEDTGRVDSSSPPKRKLEGVVPPLVKRRRLVDWACGSDGKTTLTYADNWEPDVN